MADSRIIRPPHDYVEEVIAGAALIVIVASTCWGVLTRYITEQPAAWSGEVAGIAFAWLVFVGAAAGVKYGAHMAIDMLVVRLPAVLRRVVLAFADLTVLGFLLALLVLSVEFSINAWGDPTSVLRLPRSVTYASVVVGSFCMLVRYFRAACRRWQGQGAAWRTSAAGAEL
jgi:TRAP-type C4-dicarboxylate transport system permease small subunit